MKFRGPHQNLGATTQQTGSDYEMLGASGAPQAEKKSEASHLIFSALGYSMLILTPDLCLLLEYLSEGPRMGQGRAGVVAEPDGGV